MVPRAASTLGGWKESHQGKKVGLQLLGWQEWGSWGCLPWPVCGSASQGYQHCLCGPLGLPGQATTLPMGLGAPARGTDTLPGGTPGQTGWGQTKEGPAPVPSLLYQGLEPQLTSVSPPGVLPDADSRVWGHGTGVVAVPGLTLTVSCSIPARAPPSASSGDGPLFH